MPQDDRSREGDHLFGNVANGEIGSTARRLGIAVFATICCVLAVFAVSRFWPESTPYDDKLRNLEQGMTWGEVEETLGTPRYVFTSGMPADGSRSWTARGIGFFFDNTLDGDVLVYREDGTDSVLLVGVKGVYPEKIDKWCIQKSKEGGSWVEVNLADFTSQPLYAKHAAQTKCHTMR